MKKRILPAVARKTNQARGSDAHKASSTAKSGQRKNRQSFITVTQQGAKKHAEEALRQSHDFLESLLEHLPNMVFVKDAQDLRFIRFNKAGEELLGYSRSELLGKNDYDCFPKEQADCFTTKDREVLAGGCLCDIPEEPIQTRHKGLRLLHTKKIPICDAEGTPLYLLGISEDITERKEAEQAQLNAHAELERRVFERTTELVAANVRLHSLSGRLIHAQEEERSRIARDLHDDVSQRLALIAIELEQLGQRPPSSGSELRACCHELLKKTRELSADLHSLSHELHPSKLDHLGLGAAVRSICSELTRRHHVSIECQCHDVPNPLPKEVALSLYRMTQEALHNIVKHSGARDATVKISGSAGMISVCISDSGVGFTPDSRVTNSGLGLISMRERMRLIGGALSIQSAPSGGTTIEMQVPLTTAASSS